MNDPLAQLVACAVLRGSFPRGVPARGCLRRQYEARREGKGWAPAHPACMDCETGKSVQAAAAREGVALGTCEEAGHAIVGTVGCEACAEARSVHEVHRREAPRPPLQERIWTEKPDAPIAAPPRHDIGLTPEQTREVAARVAAAEAAPRLRTTPAHPRVAVVESMPMRAPVTSCACGCGRALRSDNRSGYAGNCGSSQSALRLARHAANQQQATHELPATAPAEEEDVMPKGYARGTPCKTCKATGPRHKKGCAEDGKAPPARSAGRRGARGGEERGAARSAA